jgi:hypothetical protein
MKKKKLTSQPDEQHGYVIFSLNADVEDFRMAFLLNKKLGLLLQRDENLLVYGSEKQEPTSYSFFYFNRDKQTCFYLIHNLNEQQSLIKNYFLLINGFFTENDENELVSEIGAIPEVLSVNPLKLSAEGAVKKGMKKTIELVNAIITDLEYHTLEMNRKKSKRQMQVKVSDVRTIKKLY